MPLQSHGRIQWAYTMDLKHQKCSLRLDIRSASILADMRSHHQPNHIVNVFSHHQFSCIAQGRQRFYSVNIGGDGLADDWSRSRAPTAPKGGKPNPNQAVEDSSEFLFGWKANTESPPLTDRTKHSSHADHQGTDLKLPPLVKHAPARSKPKSRDKKQPVYEVRPEASHIARLCWSRTGKGHVSLATANFLHR